MGYKGRVFFRCGIQRKRFSSVVGHKGKGFFHCGIQWRTISGWLINFFPLYRTMQEFFFGCILHHKRILCSVLLPLHRSFFCTVSHTGEYLFFVINTTQKNCRMQCRKIFCFVSHNATGFLPFYPTVEEMFLCCGIQTEEVFSRCGIQRKRFSSIVGYGTTEDFFFSLWDTTEEVFFLCGIQWRKMIQWRMIF